MDFVNSFSEQKFFYKYILTFFTYILVCIHVLFEFLNVFFFKELNPRQLLVVGFYKS